MPSAITFANLVNGQVLEALPYEVTGQVTVTPNAARLQAVARQLDDNPLEDITGNCNPPPASGQAGPHDFSTELTSQDCPCADTYYMLTIYCWDNQADTVSIASVTFKTAAAPGASLSPGSPGAPGGG
jgi:hypothetical protein